MFRYAPSQGLPVALKQYAPGKEVWIDGKLWTSGALYSPIPSDLFNAWSRGRLYLECEVCRYAKTVGRHEAERGERGDCPACGAEGRFGSARNCIRPPGFAHPYTIEEGTSPDDQPALRVDEPLTLRPALLATDVALRTGAVHHPGRGVPQRPAQRLGFGNGEGAGAAELSEPAHQSVGETHDGQPGSVGVDVGEREPTGTGVLQPFDIVLDMGVGPHVGVQVDGVTGSVGVVALVAEHRRGEQGLLRPGCNGSRRTISRVPVGQPDRSTRSVSSATAAPGRSSPSWRIAGCH